MNEESSLEGKIDKCTMLYDCGLCHDALKCYEEVVKFKPDVGVSYYLKGMCLYRLNKFHEAIECFDKSVGLDTDQHLPHQAKAVCLMRLKNYDEAVQSLKRALQKKPNDVETMFLISCCFLFLDDEQSAREWVDISKRFDPLKTRGMLQLFFESFVLGNEEMKREERELLQKNLEKIGRKKEGEA